METRRTHRQILIQQQQLSEFIASAPKTMKPLTYKGSFARLRWQMLQEIQIAILESGGIIFGGFVRDKILHDHFADAFYLSMEQETDRHKRLANVSRGYDNPEIHAASWPWRAIMPHDVDVAITTDKIPGMKAALEREGFVVKQEFETTASIYCDNPHAQAHEIKHTRFYVELQMHRLIHRYTSVNAQIPKIKLDVLHKGAFEAREVIPFGTIDFECNSLVLKPDNSYDLMNSPMLCNPLHKAKKIAEIIKDITELRAVAVKPASYRTSHMLGKGFVVTNGVITLEPAVSGNGNGDGNDNVGDNNGIGNCIICQESLEVGGTGPLNTYASTAFVVKNNCCEARYHAKCYHESRANARTAYNNKAKCMMCRSDVPKCGACVRMRKNSGFRLIGVSLTMWDNAEQDVCRGGCGSRNGVGYNHLQAFVRQAVLRQTVPYGSVVEEDAAAESEATQSVADMAPAPVAIMDLRNVVGLLSHDTEIMDDFSVQ